MKDLKIFNIDVKIIRGRETMQRRSNITGGEGGGDTSFTTNKSQRIKSKQNNAISCSGLCQCWHVEAKLCLTKGRSVRFYSTNDHEK